MSDASDMDREHREWLQSIPDQINNAAATERRAIADALAIRLNCYLAEMKPNYDDSITGFNEAWNIVTKYLNERDSVIGGVSESDEWRPISSAPRDATPVILLTKSPIPGHNREFARHWDGIQIICRHPGPDARGHDIGWAMAAPIAQDGGMPDDWFVGWRPLGPPLFSRTQGAGRFIG